MSWSSLCWGTKGQRYIGKNHITWALTGAPPPRSSPTGSIRFIGVPPLSLGAAHWQKPQTICLKLVERELLRAFVPGHWTETSQRENTLGEDWGGETLLHAHRFGTLRQEDHLRYKACLGYQTLWLVYLTSLLLPGCPSPAHPSSPQGTLSSGAKRA